MKGKIIFGTIILICLCSCTLSPQEPPSNALEEKETLIVVERVLKTLDEQYVYPKVASAMRQHIEEKISVGEYQHFQSSKALINRLESDLRHVSNDGHLSLSLVKHVGGKSSPISSGSEHQQEFEASVLNHTASHTKIAYLRFNKFIAGPKMKRRIVEAMKEFSVFESLIVDLRENEGGDANLAAFLSSYFVADDTHLWSVLDRNGDTVIEARSSRENPSAKTFSGNVCVLISKKTYSAAEAFTYTIKHAARACVVGEKSGGGAHLIHDIPLNQEVMMRVPIARAYSPITKRNWEGVGVAPTIQISAMQAKREAIKYLVNQDSTSNFQFGASDGTKRK